MFKRILCAIDGSEFSERATETALELAAGLDAEVLFVHVLEIDLLYVKGWRQGFDPGGTIGAIEAEGNELLDRAVEKATSRGLAARKTLVDGDTVPAIAGLAKIHECDLIVLGSHGRGGLARLVLGSVADGVVRGSAVPVVIVPPGRSAGAPSAS
jgi:nucleotide-binding universal stress UspA family protein